MLNKESLDAVNNVVFSEKFMRPLNETYCFENIPGTVKYLLGDLEAKPLPSDVLGPNNKPVKKVVLLLLDGFGWTFFEKYKQQSKFLNEALDHNEAVVSKLTTQFPSSTTSNITTMHTGLPVSQTGVIEWYYYEPKLDDVYCPFLYSRAGDEEKETLATKILPDSILPKRSIYEDLSKRNIKSYTFHYDYINESTYSSLISREAENINYNGIDQGFEHLRNKLRNDEKAYYYFYYPDFDKYCHIKGPHSQEAESEIIKTLKKLDMFIEQMKNELEDTVFILTADHGQTSVKPERAVYINKEYPELLRHLKTKTNGEYITPCGGFRNMFLHIKDGQIDYVKDFLGEKLEGKAEVFKISDFIKEGIFGDYSPSPEFLSRIGDLVILPYKDEAVWWYEEDKFGVNILGQHGGLTKEEIEIPFIIYPFK